MAVQSATQVFSGNAAIPYAAFNLRDPYYREMAGFVIAAAQARFNKPFNAVVDLGAGIGISTMEILTRVGPHCRVVAVEPEEGMRYICNLNVMGDPRVVVCEGRGENLAEAVRFAETLGGDGYADAVICSQVFHLFNPPGKESLVSQVLAECGDALRSGGVLAFDLGPSNYEFSLPIADHRSPVRKPGEILTELAHPFYQRAHELLFYVVSNAFPEFDRENLWPAPSARMSAEFLSAACEKAGFRDLRVVEILTQVQGRRVIEFIRNGWSVFFRWPPLSDLTAEEKTKLMRETMQRLFREPNFNAMCEVIAYHPTAVFTTVKR